MTRQKAIYEHRKLWNWIADENEKLIGMLGAKPVSKHEYFEQFGINEIPMCDCYLCEYAIQCCRNAHNQRNRCIYCPLEWPNEHEMIQGMCKCQVNPKDGLYRIFLLGKDNNDVALCAKTAKAIANLPVRPIRIKTEISNKLNRLKDNILNNKRNNSNYHKSKIEL